MPRTNGAIRPASFEIYRRSGFVPRSPRRVPALCYFAADGCWRGIIAVPSVIRGLQAKVPFQVAKGNWPRAQLLFQAWIAVCQLEPRGGGSTGGG